MANYKEGCLERQPVNTLAITLISPKEFSFTLVKNGTLLAMEE